MDAVALLTAVILLLVSADTDSGQCSQKISSIYGKRLVNHTYQTIKAENLGDCLIRCGNQFSDRCRSINWDLMTNNCDLNNAKYEDQREDLKDKHASIYMTSIVAFGNSHVCKPIEKEVPTSSHEKSCNAVLKSGKSKGNGEYWIDPENTGNPIKVYCDMTTAGGGWMLIKNRTLTKPLPSFSRIRSDNYRDISKHNQLSLYLTTKALFKLRIVTGASQIRWFCTKKRDGGRVFHVVTKTNSEGTKVFEFFTDVSKTHPTACGSFDNLPDDNSVLSKNCKGWGKKGSDLRVNKWSWDPIDDDLRIFRTVARWENNYAFGMDYDEFTCDDHYNSNKDTISDGDRWLVYMK